MMIPGRRRSLPIRTNTRSSSTIIPVEKGNWQRWEVLCGDDGTATHYGYDPVSLRLNSIVTADKSRQEANDLQRLSYNYSPAGNVTSITDDLNGIAYGYQYDALQRLTKEVCTGGGPWMAHSYDDAGNILTRTLGQTQMAYQYGDPSRRNLLTGITVNGAAYSFVYDARGNLVEGADLTELAHVGTRTIIYDAEGVPVTISNTQTGYTVDMEYDAQGMRAAKRVRGGMETLYAFAHYEEKGGVATKYIFADGTRIAKVESEKVKYLHPDHLGSTSLVTDDTGTKVSSQEYMPFGMARGANVTSETNYQYTGQEYDAETGLYWYGSRYYDPVIGRFIMADTMVPDITDTQSLNPYSYCLNNPLKYTDPTGHSVKEKKLGIFVKDPDLDKHILATVVIGAIGAVVIIAGVIAMAIIPKIFIFCAGNTENVELVTVDFIESTVSNTSTAKNIGKSLLIIGFAGTAVAGGINWVYYYAVTAYKTGEKNKEGYTISTDFTEKSRDIIPLERTFNFGMM